jgi:hypothetical protein
MSNNITTLPLSSIEIFRLSGSLWGGEAALKADDLDPSVRQALPPKELASLGRKRVYPKGPLENLRSVRYRAYMALRRLGVSIFDGAAYALDPALSGRAVDMLAKVKADFESVKSNFIDGYQIRFDDWIMGVDPKWQPAIRAALPPVQEVERRIRFGWQQFRLSEPLAAPAPGDTLQEEVSHLGDAVFEQLADSARIAWNKQNGGWKDASGWRSVPDAIKLLVDKARNCSLFDPRLASLAAALDAAAKAACRKSPGAADMCILKGMLLAVQDPERIKEMCEAPNMFTEAAAFGAASGFMPEPEPAPVPVPEAEVPEALLAEAEEAAELAAPAVQAPAPAPEPEPEPAQEEIDPELAALLGL